jgi:hypothetical protein
LADSDQPLAADEPTRRWQDEIARAQKYFRDWDKRGEKMMKLYKRQEATASVNSKRSFAMLWANTEVMKPVVAARPPVPQISRRFKDKDPIGRVAAELLERASTYELERMGIWSILKNVRDDLLLPGRGTVWARYEVDTGPDNQITYERAQIDYVYWRDYLCSPARVEEEVWWKAKRVFMTKEQGKARFKDKWKGVQLDHKANPESADPTQQEAKATVWEIWNKRDRETIFMAHSCDHLLERGPPPLDFEGFYPCPPPVYSTLTTDSLIPTPDYAYYQDQAEEIDDLTARIAHLTDRLKVNFLYPAGKGDITDAITKAFNAKTDNMGIPVESWAALGGDKGMKDVILWLPIEQVVATLQACVELRTQIIHDIYQIMGLSDIQRGDTDPNETFGAQELKSQWGSIRIRDRQNAFAQFAKDTLKLVCEIIAERFEPMRIIQMANMMPEPPPLTTQPQGGMEPTMLQQPAPSLAQGSQAAPVAASPAGAPMNGAAVPNPVMEAQKKAAELQAATQLLKDERIRCFRIDIETDSTIAPDENAEKERRNEFLAAVGSFIKEAAPIVAGAPELMPMIKEMFLFTVRGFRAGRMMEDVIERSLDALEAATKQKMASGPPPDPKVALETRKFDEVEKVKGLEEVNKLKLENQVLDQQVANAPIQIDLQNEAMRTDMQAKKDGVQIQRDGVQVKRDDQQITRDQNVADNKFRAGESQWNHGVKAQEMTKAGMSPPQGPVEMPPDPMQIIMQGFQQLGEALQQIGAGQEQLAQLISAPRQVTGPSGRVYTSTIATNGNGKAAAMN